MNHRIGVINVPTNVGLRAWTKCWQTMRKNSGVFGMNEVLAPRAKRAYRALAMAWLWGVYGINQGPNPIFWDKRNWKFIDGGVVLLHEGASGRLADSYPGFNGPRGATWVTLENLGHPNTPQVMVINAHLVPRQHVNEQWERTVRMQSIRTLRKMTQNGLKIGCIVYFVGDTNMADFPDLGPEFTWIEQDVDKEAVAAPAGYEVTNFYLVRLPAPTDHKYGIVGHSEVTRVPTH